MSPTEVIRERNHLNNLLEYRRALGIVKKSQEAQLKFTEAQITDYDRGIAKSRARLLELASERAGQ